MLAFMDLYGLMVIIALVGWAVSWSTKRGKDRARRAAMGRLDSIFDGRQRVTTEVLMGFTAEELIGIAESRGYALAHTVPGAGRDVPTLVFELQQRS